MREKLKKNCRLYFTISCSYWFWFRYMDSIKQDGWLAPAYFSQDHKYFDQHLPSVKDETIV